MSDIISTIKHTSKKKGKSGTTEQTKIKRGNDFLWTARWSIIVQGMGKMDCIWVATMKIFYRIYRLIKETNKRDVHKQSNKHEDTQNFDSLQ